MQTKKQNRILAAALALAVLLGVLTPGVFAEDGPKYLTYYDSYSDVNSLLFAADEALAEGADKQKVKAELYSLAEKAGLSTALGYAVSNIAASETDGYYKMLNACSGESFNHFLNLWYTPDYAYMGGADVYGTIDVSDELKALLADKNAQYCLEPYYWPDASMRSVFGASCTKYTPKAPRAGYACLFIAPGAMIDAKHTWTEDEKGTYLFLNQITDLIDAAASDMGEACAPVFTGNPNLASQYWIADLQYTSCGWYGNNEVEGFDCELSLKVVDAATKQTIATLSAKSTLGSTIYSWYDGVAEAELPDLREAADYSAFVRIIKAALQRGRGLLAANNTITEYNAQEVLNGVLLQKAEKVSDAWQKAIYTAGAGDVILQEDTVTFLLRSYLPTAEEAYREVSEGQRDWLKAALYNAMAYTLEVSLPVQNGKITNQGLNTLEKTVTAAAAAAKKAFAGEDMQQALKDWFFPSPLETKEVTAETLIDSWGYGENFNSLIYYGIGEYAFSGEASYWALLFYAQKEQTINLNGGPHSIVMNCVGVAPEQLSSEFYEALFKEQIYLSPAERMNMDDDFELILLPAAEEAIEKRKTAAERFAVTFDILDITGGAGESENNTETMPAEYTAYLARYTQTEAVNTFCEKMEQLPDHAAEKVPKNGVIQNQKSGTQVTVRVPKNGTYTYVQIQGYYDGTVYASGFIHPGSSITFKVPEGDDYQVLWGTGEYWFGTEYLFGAYGSYNKTEEYSVPSSKYTVTLTLEPVQDGTVGIYGADFDDFSSGASEP